MAGTRALLKSSLYVRLPAGYLGTNTVPFAVLILLSFCHPLRAEELPAIPEPLPTEMRFNNPWPASLEAEYRKRVAYVLEKWRGEKPKGGTYGENEKNHYPRAMFAFLTGDRATALKALQEEDNQAGKDHAHTEGIDYYWSFTLKGQIRKYFYFGAHLDPAYRKRMFDGAKHWTEQDPLRRPHPVYGAGKRTPGVEAWGPDAHGSWVDVRSTDNLRAMRDTSVYLMAEETGNEATRRLYKERIKDYVVSLYHIGMSEWDSPNYHAHALSTYHNLFDFAKDPEVKLLAKAALDWLYAAGAVKYRRGGWGAPNARDYGGNAVFLANAPHALWLYAGDTPQPDPSPDRDAVYHITSAYRPPQAVVALARKQFPQPVEMFASHPPYRFWKHGEPIAPEFWETQFFGRTYQMGSAVSPGTGGPWNVNAFKLLADNSARGVDYFVANTETVLGQSFKRVGDQIGQYRNLLLWLRPAAPSKPFVFQVPKTAARETEAGILFVRMEKTWLALRPVGIEAPVEFDPFAEAKSEKDRAAAAAYRDEAFLRAETQGSGYAGFALEVGEPGAFTDYAAFRRAVLAKSRLDLAGLTQGVVELTGADGRRLRLTHNRDSEMPRIERDGVRFDPDAHRDIYRPVDGAAPIAQAWQRGTLRVEAGGKGFEQTVTPDGRVTFREF